MAIPCNIVSRAFTYVSDHFKETVQEREVATRHQRRVGSLFMADIPELQKTPVSYTKDEAHKIREMISADRLLECPRCGELLHDVTTISAPKNQADLLVVNCHNCNRMAFLQDENEHETPT
jgi:hypothetical protein